MVYCLFWFVLLFLGFAWLLYSWIVVAVFELIRCLVVGLLGVCCLLCCWLNFRLVACGLFWVLGLVILAIACVC